MALISISTQDAPEPPPVPRCSLENPIQAPPGARRSHPNGSGRFRGKYRPRAHNKSESGFLFVTIDLITRKAVHREAPTAARYRNSLSRHCPWQPKTETFLGDSERSGLTAHRDLPAVRFLGFAGPRVFGIRPIVEGVQSVADRLEQFGLRAGHVFFLRDFH